MVFDLDLDGEPTKNHNHRTLHEIQHFHPPQWNEIDFRVQKDERLL